MPQLITLNYVALAGLLIAASSLLMGVTMFMVGANRLTRSWGAFCLAVFVWGTSFFFISTARDAQLAELWWRISHVGVILIPVLFLRFVHVFLKLEGRTWLRESYWLAALLLLSLPTDFLITGVRFAFGSFYYDTPGPLYLPFVIFFNGVIVYGHWLLLQAYLHTSDMRTRQQIRYFFMATFVGFLGGGISFAPVFGIDMYPYTIVTVSLYPIIMGYAILRYHLFDLRVVAAQIASLTIVVFMFVRLAVSQSSAELIMNVAFLAVAAGLGIFLVRSVTKEVEQRERLEKLTHDLEHANERLRVLDQQKSEFVSIAAHQLRTPITAIKGYSSLLLEGSYGKLTKKVAEPLQTIYDSSDRMADTIDDFLNVSRIELGRMEYHMEPFNLEHAVEETVDAFQLTAKQKGLDLSYEADGCAHGTHTVNADPAKIQHVINNLIDNAIKYTLEGAVVIRLSCGTPDRMVKVSVHDSGAGIPKEALPKLFEKFVRAKNANSVNVSGSGLGLYVAKQMIVAHKGRIWAESEGEGKGATFSFELPLAETRGAAAD